MAILSASHISKRFPGVQALSGVSIEIQAGSCHALMGENGAGKSTLGKIFAGLYAPDEGTILLDDKPVHFAGPQQAVAAGIAMVHQELLFAENMTVAENLCLGHLPNKGPWLDRSAMIEKSCEWLRAIGSNIDPMQRLGDLPISKQQLVQIASGIGQGARVLLFDEPTSSLAQAEVENLMGLIRELRQNGVTCVYVSHRLEEIFALCDTITVLRDGKPVDTVPIKGLSRDSLVKMMIGRDLAESLETHFVPDAGAEFLRVENLSSEGKFRDISFSVRRGEIVGLAGLVGAGRTEITEAIFGLDPHVKGKIFISGQEVKVKDPIHAMELGIGLVPEDRKRHGLVLTMNSRENVSLPNLDHLAHFTWIDRGAERETAQTYFDRMRVKAPTLDTPSVGLSGGNQQKLVIAKWLAAKSDLLIVDEPTRGVDVGAKAEIHALIRGLAEQGKAVLVVSSDLPELLALSSRILVMREGNLVGEIDGEQADQENVMRLMAGVARV
jgi:ABC-type sugar transport system ATPase subunit